MNTKTRKPLPHVFDSVEYFDHQLNGVRKMQTMSSFILADEMGLGKTPQVITVADVAFKLGMAKRVLVIAAASLKAMWGDEINKFSSFSWEILEGGPDDRVKQLNDFKSEMLIVNYEQIVKHVDLLNKMNFDIVIYDEAHAMQNRKSARTKAIFKLWAPRHFVLTGSPMLNYVDGLWSVMHRVAPHEFPNYWAFINRYAVMGGYNNKQIVGVKNEAELRAKVYKYMIRREKKDCLDLPDKLVKKIKLILLPEQKKVYQEAEKEMQISGSNGAELMTIANGMTKILRLKQITSTLACIPGQPDISVKLDWTVAKTEQLVRIGGEPVVIWTQFRPVIACLERRFDEIGMKYKVLHGDVKIGDRNGVVKTWTAEAEQGNPMPIICMYSVAGVGLTMTAACNEIAVDQLYVPKLRDQAYDRCHRIGQTRVVNIYELFARGTVETRIDQIIKVKEGLFDAIISNNSDGWNKLLLQAVSNDPSNEE